MCSHRGAVALVGLGDGQLKTALADCSRDMSKTAESTTRDKMRRGMGRVRASIT